MKILVTGGTGFLGSALCSSLIKHGHGVVSLALDCSDELEGLGVRQ